MTELLVAPSIAVVPANHWYDSGAVPEALAFSVVLEPLVIVTDCGSPVIVVGLHTVTVAGALSSVPQLFVTRTKYVVVAVGDTVTELLVAPLIAVVPANHWYDSGAVPVALACSVVLDPLGIVTDCGSPVIVAGLHTVTVAGALSSVPQLFVTRTK
ncbi:MAG TPA: hypothetical protein VF266_12180 [Thermoanaerobaculia bacterium]